MGLLIALWRHAEAAWLVLRGAADGCGIGRLRAHLGPAAAPRFRRHWASGLSDLELSKAKQCSPARPPHERFASGVSPSPKRMKADLNVQASHAFSSTTTCCRLHARSTAKRVTSISSCQEENCWASTATRTSKQHNCLVLSSSFGHKWQCMQSLPRHVVAVVQAAQAREKNADDVQSCNR